MPVPHTVRYKVFRAYEHLKELEAEIGRYYETNPAKMVRQAEGSPNEYIGKIVANGPVPARIPMIIGDCVQNLRSSLDYLVWELVLAAKNNPIDRNMFPICTTPEAFIAQRDGHRLDGIAQDAVTEIDRLQPYHHGKDAAKDMLAVIDHLCHIDKHRRVLLTHLHGAIAPHPIITQEINGQPWAEVDLGAVLDKDAKIGPFPIVDGPEGPGLQVNVKPHLLAFIAFDAGAAKDMSVGIILGGMLRYINDGILPKFDRFF